MKYEREIGDWTTNYAVSIIKLCSEMRKRKLDLDVIVQLRKCGTSVGANVNEGKHSSSKKEFIRFYEIALRSCGEVLYWIKVIRLGYEFESVLLDACEQEAQEIKKVLTTIIIKLKK